MPDGRIVIGLSENYEILFFSPDKGKIGGFQHKYKPVKVTNDPHGRFINRVEVKGKHHFRGNTLRLGNLFASVHNDFDDIFQVSLFKIVSVDK